MGVHDFRELAAWQRVDELRREIIAFTSKEPASKDFKFRDQIRDAIGSACRNTSEGWGRFRPADNAPFIEYARASIDEVQDGLIEAKEKKYIDAALYDRLWTLTRRALGEKPWLKNATTKKPKPENP